MQKKILIIDDEMAFLLPMRKMLQGPELHVDIAETMEDAMGLLQRKNFDAVLADIRLSGALNTEGLDILDFIKREIKETKVIIMTGYGSPEIMKDAYKKKADYYFEKPVSIGMLSDALRASGVLA